MLLSVGMRTIVALAWIAAFSIAADAKTSVYTIPGEASAVVTTSPDFVTFRLTDLFTNPMDLLDDLSGFFAAFGPGAESAQSPFAHRPLLQIRVEGMLRGDTGTHPESYCRFFPPRPVEEMSGGLNAAAVPALFDARGAGVDAKPSPFAGDAHIALLDRTATWTVAEMGGGSFHRIGSVRFQFGTTDGRDQVSGVLPARREPSLPGMLAVAAILVLAALILRRKQKRLSAPIIVRSPASSNVLTPIADNG
jgi:hypothetical protein